MFSPRTPSNLGPNPLAQAIAARRLDGRPYVDLTESNPTRVGLAYPQDLLSALASPEGLRYEPHALGLEVAREAVAADYARRGERIAPGRIVITSSTSEAYSLLFKLLAGAGDDVLVPRPSYPLFDHLTRLEAVVPRPYDLEYHGVWSIDFAALEAALTPRTRAVLLVSPNNPTGSFVSATEIDRLADLCAPRGVALIADEVFADYLLDPAAEVGRGSFTGRDDVLAFSLGGLSKSVGLPQVKLAWIAASGPGRVVGEALARLEFVCDTYLSVATPVQLAAPSLLDRGADIRRQIQQRVTANYRTLGRASETVPSCRALSAQGGWYAVVQVPALRPEEEIVLDLLESESVLLHPGYFFDFPREAFLVFSLLASERMFAEAVPRVLARVAV